MLYKFKSRAAADLIMLEPHGQRMLEIVGKTPGASGILTVAQIPAAVAAIEAAVLADDALHARKAQDDEPDAPHDDDAPGAARDSVRLRQRAAPFLELLRRSLSEEVDVVWGV